MMYVGMDVHKRTTTFCTLNDDGDVVKRGKVDSSESGWTSMIEAWAVNDVRVALETGNLTWWVVDVFREIGIEPVVVDARQFKLIAHSKKKNDKHDARALADALRGGLAERYAVEVPSDRARRGRSLLRTRQLMVKQSVACLNAARAMLRSVGVSLTKKAWSRTESWEAVLADRAISDWMRPLLVTYHETWEFLETKRASLTAMATAELSHWGESNLLLDMPGYGPFVTLGVLSHLDDPHRFHSSNQVASYAGLVPSCRDSGDSVRRGGITHQGSSLLRHLMIQCSWAALRSRQLTPALRKWVRRLIVKRGIRIAVVALARRLLVLSHRLLLTGEVYTPLYSRTERLAA